MLGVIDLALDRNVWTNPYRPAESSELCWSFVASAVTPAPEGRGWRMTVDGGNALIALTGDWVARTDGVDPDVAGRVLRPGIRTVGFKADGLGRWDSGLIAFLLDLREAAKAAGVSVDEAGLPGPARRLLALASDRVATAPTRARTPFLDRVGLWAIGFGAELVETSALVGSVALRGGVAITGRASMRGADLIDRMYEAGASALPIVTVVNLLVGGILAFIGATELRTFGAGLYVANLVAIGMVREMAALMTAIIMSGRTGGAYAATISAMQGAEEIDALRSMGIPVFDYLILPRVLALTGMMPLLYFYGAAVGILGGLCVGAATLGVTPTSFFIQAQLSLSGPQLSLGLAKSIAFGALIAILSCRVGLRAGRSAADVGQAATSAVVASIVGVIALDAAFDVCADVLGV